MPKDNSITPDEPHRLERALVASLNRQQFRALVRQMRHVRRSSARQPSTTSPNVRA